MQTQNHFLTRSRRSALCCVLLIGFALPAWPQDLINLPGKGIEDLTPDATNGIIYFIAGGQNFLYRPASATSPVSLADLFQAINEAPYLLVEEANPRKSGDYYNGQPARVLPRILVRAGKPR